jgi:hypothetical protein
VESVKAGRCNTLPPDIELFGSEIAALYEGWAKNVTFAMLSYDEARKLDPNVDNWMLLAENAASGAHTFIWEDPPVLPKEPG